LSEPGAPHESQEDVAESMIVAMQESTEDELHQYIAESGTQIREIFTNYLNYLRNDPDRGFLKDATRDLLISELE
jgi:hypothetical protein